MEKMGVTLGARAKDLKSKIEDHQDLRSVQIKQIVEDVGLTSTRFEAYHCKAVRILGAQRYMDLADMARKGKNPYTLMSWLLKEEMNAKAT